MRRPYDPNQEKKMTILQHTVELLGRLRTIVISVIFLGFFVAFWPLDLSDLFSPTLEYTPLVSVIMHRMKEDLLPAGARLIAGNIMDTAYLYLTISIMIGVILSTPVIAYELYMFFNPALYPHERRWVSRIVFSFVGLFLFGAVLAYRVMLPITFRILMWFVTSTGAEPFFNIADFVGIIVTLVVGVGLLYVSPIFIVFLAAQGIISSSYLTSNRKLVYAGFIVVAAILTPDPTIVSDLLLFVPWLVLYEATIAIVKRMEKKRASS
ncbi:MAG: twin-arginine translocase subunit TatC [Candidatus Bathyarchaeia archaeon]